MNPKTIQALRERTPELDELVTYLAQKARESYTLEALEGIPMGELSFRTAVMLEVHKRLLDILEPLLKDNSGLSPSDPSDYVV